MSCDSSSGGGGNWTHAGVGLGDEEELGEGSVQRQQHGDAGGILAQAVFHGGEELPQRPQQRQLTGSARQNTATVRATSAAFQYSSIAY